LACTYRYGGAADRLSSAAEAESNQIQANIIKTMITVSAFYAVTWLPIKTYYLLVNLNVNLSLSLLESGYYSVVFVAFLYFCTNPFIYATCTQARKTTHGLDGQHHDADRTSRGRVSQNDRGQR